MIQMSELDLAEAGKKYYIVINQLADKGGGISHVNGARAVPFGPDALEWVNGYLESLEWEMLEEEAMDDLVINPKVFIAEVLDPIELPGHRESEGIYLLFFPDDSGSGTVFDMYECDDIEDVAAQIEEEMRKKLSLEIEAVILARAIEVDLVLTVPNSFDQMEAERELTGG